MQAYCYISVVGTQAMGTLNPLLALLEEGLQIRSVCLLASEKVEALSLRCKDFIEKLGLDVEIEPIAMPHEQNNNALHACDAVALYAESAHERDERPIYNIAGGTNQMIAQCFMGIAPFKPILVQALKDTILYDDGTHLRQSRAPKVLKAQDIFSLQGVDVNLQDESSFLVDFCKRGKLSLPPSALQNVTLDGEPFDLVWTRANNRLAFLVSCLGQHLPSDGAERLAHLRRIAHWAATRERSGNMFDRELFAVVDAENSREHLKSNAEGKITIGDVQGWKGNPQILREELATAFVPIVMKPAQPIALKKRNPLSVEADTLILVMGKDPSATLLSIATHKPKHVIICHTQDKSTLEQATRLRELKESFGLESVRLLPCDYDGAIIPRCLAAPEEPAKVHVNVTAGTKGQGAYLMQWALEHGCCAWAVQQATKEAVCLAAGLGDGLGATLPSIPLHTADSMLLFAVQGKDIDNDDVALGENKTLNLALLSFLHASLGTERQDLVFSTSVKVDDTVLWPQSKSSWELILPDKTKHQFSKDGGEWLELLAAQAFCDAGAHCVHARVRENRSAQRAQKIRAKHGDDAPTFLKDMDVVGSYGGNFFLVSCKSSMDEHADMASAIAEARAMAKAIDRFTLPLLCHLGCKNYYYNEEHKVVVVGWRELCQPDILHDIMQLSWSQLGK